MLFLKFVLVTAEAALFSVSTQRRSMLTVGSINGALAGDGSGGGTTTTATAMGTGAATAQHGPQPPIPPPAPAAPPLLLSTAAAAATGAAPAGGGGGDTAAVPPQRRGRGRCAQATTRFTAHEKDTLVRLANRWLPRDRGEWDQLAGRFNAEIGATTPRSGVALNAMLLSMARTPATKGHPARQRRLRDALRARDGINNRARVGRGGDTAIANEPGGGGGGDGGTEVERGVVDSHAAPPQPALRQAPTPAQRGEHQQIQERSASAEQDQSTSRRIEELERRLQQQFERQQRQLDRQHQQLEHHHALLQKLAARINP